MKKHLLFSVAAISVSLVSNAQTTLFSETFNSGTAGAFTLNTSDVGSTAAGYNFYVVNNAYTGGNGSVMCLGSPFAYTIVNTAAQPAGITGGPNSHYMHTMSTAGQADNIFCSSFAAADGICYATQHTFAKMTNGINTTGYSGVSFSFWWTCGGGNGKYGEVYYSTNGGVNWTLITTPISQYNNQATWIQQTITMAAFDNVADLRFGFRFFNTANFNAVTDPGFSIDDVKLIGTTACAPSASTQNPTICQGQSFFAQGANQTTSGTYYDTLVNYCGQDSVITTNLTVTPINLAVNVSGTLATAQATPAIYQWYNCSEQNVIAGATGQSFSPVATAQYAVIVTQSGCTDTSACTTVSGTGIELLQNAYSFEVWPNPFNEQAIIKINGVHNNTSELTITMVDALGRKVNPVIRKQQHEIIISRNGLPKGIYFVQLTANQQTVGIVKLIAD